MVMELCITDLNLQKLDVEIIDDAEKEEMKITNTNTNTTNIFEKKKNVLE